MSNTLSINSGSQISKIPLFCNTEFAKNQLVTIEQLASQINSGKLNCTTPQPKGSGILVKGHFPALLEVHL